MRYLISVILAMTLVNSYGIYRLSEKQKIQVQFNLGIVERIEYIQEKLFNKKD